MVTDTAEVPSVEKHLLLVNGQYTSRYEIVEPAASLNKLSLLSLSREACKPSSLAFTSASSITNGSLAHKLSPLPHRALQTSWINIAQPLPVGASHLALFQDGESHLPIKTQEHIEIERAAPVDRYHLVYLILIVHGIGNMLPWDMLLTADSYFTEFKLKPLANETEKEYSKNFLSYMGIASQIPVLILNALNVFCQIGEVEKAATVRIAGSLSINVFMFVLTTILAMVNSNQWQDAFFGLTIASTVIINGCSGIHQNTLFGLAGKLPMKYTNAIIFGSNISGVLTALILIIAISGSPHIQLAAIWYFITAVIILCITLTSYFVLPLLKFYKHFFSKAAARIRRDSHVSSTCENSRPPYWEIFKQMWIPCLGVFLTYFVSLLCFPAIQADVKLSDPDFFITEKLFTPITTFLLYNLFAALGNFTSEWVRVPGPKLVIVPVLLRLLFIPFFMFCNYRPEIRTLPVYINNDFAYIAGGMLMAYTGGYYSSLCMMYAPRLVQPRYAATAAMISAYAVVMGIAAGMNSALLVAKIVEF